MNWPRFTVEVSGIATLIYTDRLLAEMFQSVSCTYHALPIWGGASHSLIPFNDDSAAVVFFVLVAVKANRHYYGLLAWSCNDFSFKG